jgi:GT2 family glycosyltransferase
MATGQIIGWINSDDYLVKNIFKEVADSFDQDTDWVVGNIFVEYRTVNKKIADVSPKITLRALQKKPGIVRQQGTFIRKDALETVGGLDENIQIAMDVDLWLKLAKLSNPKMTNRRWAYFVFHKDQKTSGKNILKQTTQAIKILRRHGGSVNDAAAFAIRNYFYYIKFEIKMLLINLGLVNKKFENISLFDRKLR